MKKITLLLVGILLVGCKSNLVTLKNQENKTNEMTLKNLHTENKPVQTNLLFKTEEGKVISLQISKNEQLKEHITKVPALLVCVSGNATYHDEKGKLAHLKSGDYINIEPNVKHWVDAKEESNFLLIK
jgi:quercetin dioxygenase-like cupin family protein